MSDPIWVEQHLINVVYEALSRLSKNGEIPVEEDYLLDEILKSGIRLSRRELAKILLGLEVIGRVSVESTGSQKKFRIKLIK